MLESEPNCSLGRYCVAESVSTGSASCQNFTMSIALGGCAPRGWGQRRHRFDREPDRRRGLRRRNAKRDSDCGAGRLGGRGNVDGGRRIPFRQFAGGFGSSRPCARRASASRVADGGNAGTGPDLRKAGLSAGPGRPGCLPAHGQGCFGSSCARGVRLRGRRRLPANSGRRCFGSRLLGRSRAADSRGVLCDNRLDRRFGSCHGDGLPRGFGGARSLAKQRLAAWPTDRGCARG